MKTYRCPVCKKPLSKREYEQALGILGEREKHLHHERDMLRNRFQRERDSLLRAIRLARPKPKRPGGRVPRLSGRGSNGCWPERPKR
jgi:hypothetical protein